MTRVAALVAVVLALLLAASPWLGSESTAGLAFSLAGGVILLLAGHGAYRRETPFQATLLAAALVILGRFLPSIFINARYWPDLLIIFLASIVFGLGLIGLILDRYTGPPKSADSVAQ